MTRCFRVVDLRVSIFILFMELQLMLTDVAQDQHFAFKCFTTPYIEVVKGGASVHLITHTTGYNLATTRGSRLDSNLTLFKSPCNTRDYLAYFSWAEIRLQASSFTVKPYHLTSHTQAERRFRSQSLIELVSLAKSTDRT